MKNFLYGLFLIFCFQGFSQDFTSVDQIVASYPKYSSSQSDLVNRINQDFKLPSEKARALFYWISTTISYDVEFSNQLEKQNVNAFSYKTEKEFQEKNKKFTNDLAAATFQTQKGVCYGYVALYKILADKLGLECELIRGNIKTDPNEIGIAPKTNHGWNAVKIDGQWKLLDCTLATGRISTKTGKFVFEYNDVFFFTNADLFLLNHFPDDTKWLLADSTIGFYKDLPIYYPNYFKEPNIIALPKTGVLKANDLLVINLGSFNKENDSVQYFFDDETSRTYLDLDNTQSKFELPLTTKSGRILFIYVNGKLFAGYKIA